MFPAELWSCIPFLSKQPSLVQISYKELRKAISQILFNWSNTTRNILVLVIQIQRVKLSSPKREFIPIRKSALSLSNVVNVFSRLKLKTVTKCKQQELYFVSNLFTDRKNKESDTMILLALIRMVIKYSWD